MTISYILLKIESNNIENHEPLQSLLCDFANEYRTENFVRGIGINRRKGDRESFLMTFYENPKEVHFIKLLRRLWQSKQELGISKLKGYFSMKEHLTDASMQEFVEGNPPELKEYLDKENWFSRKWKSISWKMFVFEEELEFGIGLKSIDFENNCLHLLESGTTRESTSQFKYEMHYIESSDYHHIIDIYPAPNEVLKKQIDEKKKWWKFW